MRVASWIVGGPVDGVVVVGADIASPERASLVAFRFNPLAGDSSLRDPTKETAGQESQLALCRKAWMGKNGAGQNSAISE
jgi:hypothetical protein